MPLHRVVVNVIHFTQLTHSSNHCYEFINFNEIGYQWGIYCDTLEGWLQYQYWWSMEEGLANISKKKRWYGGDKVRHDADLSFLLRRFTRSTILSCSSVSLTSLFNSGVNTSAFTSASESSSSVPSINFRLRGESLGVRSKSAGADITILSDLAVRFFGLGLGLGDAPTSDAGRPYVAKDLRSAVNNTFCTTNNSLAPLVSTLIRTTHCVCPTGIVAPYALEFGIDVFIELGCHVRLPACGPLHSVVLHRNLVHVSVNRNDFFLD